MVNRPHAVALAAAAGLAAPVAAGPLRIAPTTVEIAPARHSAVIEVFNDGDAPVDVQFRAYDWSQLDGRDRLQPSTALVVSPAIATVAPHAKQLFRVLEVDGPGAPTTERSWRLRLNEIPPADRKGVAVALEFSLPVFHLAADATPRLQWQAEAGGVRVTNGGGRRVRLADLALHQPGGERVALSGATAAYLLAGSSRVFATPVLPGAGTRVAGLGDTGPIDAAPTQLAVR